MGPLSPKHSKLGLSDRAGWGPHDPHPALIAICCIILMIGLSCQRSRMAERPQSPLSSISSTALNISTPAPGHGRIQGRIIRPSSFSNGVLFVYLARITWAPDGQVGAYILDPSAGLWTPISSEGYFYLNVPPGDYVVFVGTAAESAIPLKESKNKLYIAQIKAGQVLDIGTWTLEDQ